MIKEFKDSKIQNWIICGDRTYKDYLEDELIRYDNNFKKAESNKDLEEMNKWREAKSEIMFLIDRIVD